VSTPGGGGDLGGLGDLVEPPDELERRLLHDLFSELCAIESPSGSERACARRIERELLSLGIEVYEDDSGPAAGSDCGNLLARIPGDGAASSLPSGVGDQGRGEREPGGSAAGSRGSALARGAGAEIEGDEHRRPSILLCAHMDTVPPQAPVEPVLCDGFWENANDGILGADNKAAVATLLVLARRVCREGAAVDLELLFTVGEERSLAGARAFDASRLRSSFGYVFDHASPIGELVLSGPTHHRLQAIFRGASAHAGVRPEQGRSAILAAARAVADMRLGRIDADTTANVGTISGGSAINVVPALCTIIAEVRSLRDQRAEEILAELLDCVHEAANLPECECDVDVTVERTFSGYRTPSSSPAVRAAERALRACGHEPVRISSGGASDANALIAAGLPVVNLANGTERNHEPGERVNVAALEATLELALALPAAAAAVMEE
jgi:tripeptide aminopeptidase